MEDDAEEAKNLEAFSCYTEAIVSKTGGGMSSPSTMTPASSSRSMASPDQVFSFPFGARDPFSTALEAMFGSDSVSREHSSEATSASSADGRMSEFGTNSSASRCFRNPQAKRQSRPSLSREDSDSGALSRWLAVRDAGGSSSGSEDQAPIRQKHRHNKNPEGFVSTFAPLDEETDEFAFVQVAQHDTTFLYSMQEEEEERDQPPSFPPPTTIKALLSGARPCSWPTFQPVQRLSLSALLSGAATRPCTLSQPQPDQPQERVQYSVRNTFIHYDNLSEYSEGALPEPPNGQNATDRWSEGRRWSSAPGAMLPKPFTTKYPKMEENHNAGNCKPCAYFFNKQDGCRNGGDCAFCHLCPEGAQKAKKKAKIRYLKDCEAAERVWPSSSPSLTMS